MPVKPIPDGYHTATPYLTVIDADGAIAFYKAAFGATEFVRMRGPDGRVAHAEIRIGDSPVMLGEESTERGSCGPVALGGSPVAIMLYVEDVDAVVATAVAEGATLTRPVTDQFYGDRCGGLQDPFGHKWHIATHKEDVSPEEMKRRMSDLCDKMKAAG